MATVQQGSLRGPGWQRKGQHYKPQHPIRLFVLIIVLIFVSSAQTGKGQAHFIPYLQQAKALKPVEWVNRSPALQISTLPGVEGEDQRTEPDTLERNHPSRSIAWLLDSGFYTPGHLIQRALISDVNSVVATKFLGSHWPARLEILACSRFNERLHLKNNKVGVVEKDIDLWIPRMCKHTCPPPRIHTHT